MATLNVIRCDLPQNDYLVWKWRPADGTTGRENQIRFGSTLRVRPGECAAIFYTRGGDAPVIEYIEGPRDLLIDTKNLPFISQIIGLAYGGDSPFPAEIYFINRGQATQMRWGVPWFDAFDPRFPDFPVPIALNGTVTLHIADVARFVAVQRLDEIRREHINQQIRPQLTSAIKANVVMLATARGIPLVQIGGRTEEIGGLLRDTVRNVFQEFGLAVRTFAVEGIELNKRSEGFLDLQKVTKHNAMDRLRVQGEVEEANLRDGQHINSTNLAESLAIQREAARLQAQTQFLTAHQINRQADVGLKAAESLGQMGGSGSGGGGGLASDVGAAAMMMGVGMPVGAMLGGSLAANLQQTLGGTRGPMTPPPLPLTAVQPVHVARQGQQLGILPLEEINRRIAQGELAPTDLGWQPGMPAWQELRTISGVVAPPPLPPTH